MKSQGLTSPSHQAAAERDAAAHGAWAEGEPSVAVGQTHGEKGTSDSTPSKAICSQSWGVIWSHGAPLKSNQTQR